MTPNIFSLYVCLLLTSLFLRSRHHQNNTITTLSPWPSFRRYLSTKQARYTAPLRSKQPHYTREDVGSFIPQLHLIAVTRGLRKPAHRSHELCAPSARSISTNTTISYKAFAIAFCTSRDYIATLGKRSDCSRGPFPPGTGLAPRSTKCMSWQHGPTTPRTRHKATILVSIHLLHVLIFLPL